ncbi:S-formylglutathione hydrolase [Brevundimonas diminuta]|mgnify:FL=1|uniref:S-formylglutathione hydrolase n=1 Tax=Brevundimonas diminuta TaxID=293 RepID=UPI000207F499|nr:S-formylglutathione hydrolase [Brevundimonas diminuta]EGF95555.1 S-formylglutathione hydrolase [Brevundimonas diminuta ATCC 11568]MBD3818543.1 S-formylglutathione hydrolase [Brevundimonas diminuta]OWR16820.1 S-formylglutathione hydrolase [Brevundimonas diminuta]WQE45642.1 S-formylglutathione hydrolase [Brevundimonas diminuta]SPU44415.1 S-formylglutathione hydrolase [Brevundimonas diminuta]
METVKSHVVHGGTLRYLKHDSATTGTPMTLSVFIPAGEGPFPVLIWLSGLTCTEDNFTTKAGAYKAAAEHGVIIVAPDTSPRGEGVADDAAYDLGQGAGFYVDATEAPWAPHFRMESYVTGELIELIDAEFPTTKTRSVFGHSMGGHGALTLALRHPELFRSVSAFAPISSPTRCPWGEKAFSAYLGEDRTKWAKHDAALLIEGGAAKGVFDDILVDQGDADSFLTDQLKPELLKAAAQKAGQGLTLRMQPGYDHSYFFMASFVDDHVAFHAKRLKA